MNISGIANQGIHINSQPFDWLYLQFGYHLIYHKKDYQNGWLSLQKAIEIA